jgi:hypothetical protein
MVVSYIRQFLHDFQVVEVVPVFIRLGNGKPRALLIFRQTALVYFSATRSADEAEAVGTATTIRADPEVRILCIAASMVNPDASPSSTRMVVFPVRSGNVLPPVNCSIRSRTFFLVSATAASTSP